MDQHPVPQDITGFQFKLVGDMTLKQFGYLAAGAVTAWLFYATGWNPVIKIPLALFSFIFGIALAFLPIQERPLETWIVNFFKSVYKPTQFVWKKSVIKLDFLDETADNVTTPIGSASPEIKAPNQEQLQAYLQTMHQAVTLQSPPEETGKNTSVAENVPPPTVDDLMAKNNPNSPPQITIDNLLKNREQAADFVDSKMRQVRREIKSDIPTTPDINDLAKATGFAPKNNSEDNLAFAISSKQQQIDEADAINRKLLLQVDDLNKKLVDISRLHEDKSGETQKYLGELENMKKLLEDLQVEKGKLEEELKMAKKGVRPVDKTARVKFIDQIAIDKAVDGHLPPNTIHGLVDDQNGSPIIGVIVLIKNTQGSPVRALRTNKLGQFLASTPLENGTYYIELEKDGYVFDEVKIDLTGTTLSPIEIKAK